MSKRLESDLWKAQKSCRQLDLGKEYSEPMEFWFWPKEKEKKVVEFKYLKERRLLYKFRVQVCQNLIYFVDIFKRLADIFYIFRPDILHHKIS